MLATCMLRLRAFDDTDIVAAAHDNPTVAELVRAEKQRRKEIELESVEYSRARCLVKQDYVACPEIRADFRKLQSAVRLVSHPAPDKPSARAGFPAVRQDIIWSYRIVPHHAQSFR
jgi:superfamily II DNA/RNA helicase